MSENIDVLWQEARDLSFGKKIDRLESPPSALRFLRDYVSQNKPCIISNAISHWPAVSRWPSRTYLSDSLTDSIVSVHLTPDGRADSLVKTSSNAIVFASPHVERMPFNRALELVLNSGTRAVAYLQQQNDCLRKEYGVLSGDYDEHIPWASDAFGCLPDAVNLWIGNQKSTTSFHKDHYENLYAVISGEKHFLLLPPTDLHRLYIDRFPAARYNYSQETGEFDLEVENPIILIPWSSIDPHPSAEKSEHEIEKFPLYFNGPYPFKCTVKAGELLYLPSLWFHHVQQTPDEFGRTIAVNYWYDMKYDLKYAYFNLLQSLTMDSRLPRPENHVSSSSESEL